VSDNSSIEWTDATWNPVTGCTEVSPGCDNCYAKTFAERFRGTKGHYFENGFDVQLRPDKLILPLKWRKPKRVFVNSMSDLFHKDIPDEYILRVWEIMARTPQHTYQILTKRHARMRSFVERLAFAVPTAEQRAAGISGRVPYLFANAGDNASLGAVRPLDNVWLGVSVENQQWADIRIPSLLDTPAAVRFLSCEPLLGPVDLDGPVINGHRPRLTYWLAGRPGWGPEETTATGLDMQPHTTGPRIDWVIVGGESGHGARPMHPEWAQRLRNQCTAAGVPFHFKQWGEYDPMAPLKDGVFDWERGIILANDGTVYQKGDLDYPDGGRRGEAIRAGHDRGSLTSMYRVGKKHAGRLLDGRTWDEFPAVAR
jgi:protein gp37